MLLDLARAQAEAGRPEDARRHVDRFQAIISRGEDWRGRCGIAGVAEAVVLSVEERLDEAMVCFEQALWSLGRFRLVADQADGLHQWGLALMRAGDRWKQTRSSKRRRSSTTATVPGRFG